MMIVSVHVALADQCGGAVRAYIASTDMPHAVNLDKGTTAQPLGGKLTFTIPTTALNQANSRLVACFRWRPLDSDAEAKLKQNKPKDWSADLPLRVVDSSSDITTVSVQVPDQLGSLKSDAWPNHKYYAYSGVWPLADFRVMVVGTDGAASLDEIIPLVITGYWWPTLITIAATLLFWTGIRLIAGWQRIPGGFFLGVISTRYGYASLSQLQIVIWTIVIGAASIYVMVLTGRLLEIPVPTLALLGIAGAATVATKIPKADGSGQPAAAPPAPAWAPGAVTNLTASGLPGSTSMVLSWSPPAGGGTPTNYAVTYRTPPGAGGWIGPPNGGAVTEAPFVVTGLHATTLYEFQVIARNDGGDGPATQYQPLATVAAGGAAVPPARVEGVSPRPGDARADGVEIGWTALAPAPEAYVVSFRRAGASRFIVAGVTEPAVTRLLVPGLTPATDYEFQVRAAAGGLVGTASTVASTKTATITRTPRLRDLLVWDGTNEIDVSRLQMLFFTLVAATFVSLKVATQNEIPTIPDGLLLLMGISNGVYLSSKFVSGQR